MTSERCPLCGNTVFLATEDAGRLCAGPLGCHAMLDAPAGERGLKPAA